MHNQPARPIIIIIKSFCIISERYRNLHNAQVLAINQYCKFSGADKSWSIQRNLKNKVDNILFGPIPLPFYTTRHEIAYIFYSLDASLHCTTLFEGISFQKRSQTITRIQYYYYYYYYTNIIIIKLRPSNVIHKDAKQGPTLLLMVVEFLRTLFGRSLLLRRRSLIGITIA